MQQVCHGMVPLNGATTIRIHRDAHRFARFRCATFDKRGTMNENVAALLCIYHAQLADLRSVMPRHMKQSTISDLSAHLGVKRGSIENNIEFLRLFAG